MKVQLTPKADSYTLPGNRPSDYDGPEVVEVREGRLFFHRDNRAGDGPCYWLTHAEAQALCHSLPALLAELYKSQVDTLTSRLTKLQTEIEQVRKELVATFQLHGGSSS